ncbi:MAG TPA: SBBP repeat-containing protein, partial [Dissulfurispiraceae bacterium]|nr:SBBP repeat-containing protein [Dissulfurispiraceae bacterium]
MMNRWAVSLLMAALCLVILSVAPTQAAVYSWHTFYGIAASGCSYITNAPACDTGAGGIAVDSSGNIYVSGTSGASWNGPGGEAPLHQFSSVTLPLYSTGGDCPTLATSVTAHENTFILKLNSSGTYQWHTF